jgi:hypothetical protein
VSSDGVGAGYLPPTEAAWLRRVFAVAGIKDRALRAELTHLAERIHAAGNGVGYERGYLDGYADADAEHPPVVLENGSDDEDADGDDEDPDPAVLEQAAPWPAARSTPMFTASPVPPWDDPDLRRLEADALSSDFPSGGTRCGG